MQDYVFNVKCSQKHAMLEYLIKDIDTSQDTSRTALLERFIETATKVKDWMDVYKALSTVDWSIEVPKLTTWQAKCDGDALQKIRRSIEKDLINGGVITKVLQNQFLLQMLMAAYLVELQKQRICISAKGKCVEEDITIPMMFSLFSELVLTDKNCDTLLKIRDLLIDWKNNK